MSRTVLLACEPDDRRVLRDCLAHQGLSLVAVPNVALARLVVPMAHIVIVEIDWLETEAGRVWADYTGGLIPLARALSPETALARVKKLWPHRNDVQPFSMGMGDDLRPWREAVATYVPPYVHRLMRAT